MDPFKKIKTEERLNKLIYDLDIARAKVYKDWGFTMDEIACLVDRPESQIRAALNEEESNAKSYYYHGSPNT